MHFTGKPLSDFCDEKTIMLVGATGSGKSTLVDGIVNFIMGVSFDDPFRFTMVTLEEEEKKSHNQVLIFFQKKSYSIVQKNGNIANSKQTFARNKAITLLKQERIF